MKFKKLKFAFPSLLAVFSFQLYFGSILGYYLTKFLSKKVRSIIFRFKNWKLHLHHWLLGLLILILGVICDFLPLLPFSVGFLGGLIFQGIYCYSDWHKILTKIK